MKLKNICYGVALVLASSIFVAGCGGSGSGGSSVGTPVDKFFSDAQAAGGLNSASLNATSYNASGVPTAYSMEAFVLNLSKLGTNKYSVAFVDNILSNTGWIKNTDPYVSYSLTDSGWVDSSVIVSFVNNLDGTMSIESLTGTSVTTVTVKDLTGTAINCYPLVSTAPTFVSGVPVSACNVPGNYPSGAVSYTFPATTLIKDSYYLIAGTTMHPSFVTNDQGALLTALPASGATFCLSWGPNNSSGKVFKAITPVPASGDNYNVYSSNSCTLSEINTGIAAGKYTTSSVLSRNTGYATVPSVVSLQDSGNPYVSILGVVSGKVYQGGMAPAGTTQSSSSLKNKIAINAELSASGSTPLPGL